MKLNQESHFVVLLVLLLASYAQAAPIAGGEATYEYFNGFISRLFPGTPFNPGPDPVDVPVETNGVFVEVWEPQVGDTIDFEIVSVTATGNLAGVPFQILAGVEQTPELGPFLGSLTQIQQDPNDPGFATGNPSSLISARRVAAGAFAQVFPDGTFAYGGAPYEFESTVDSLPYSVGSEFIGTISSEVPVFVRQGDLPDPAVDPQIGVILPGGVVRITRVVPEPATSVLLVAGLLATWIAGQKSRRLR